METLRRVAALVIAAAIMGGCSIPPQPSASDWQRQALQSLEDVSSEVATAQVTLREQAAGHLVGKTGVVLLVDAEETAGSTVETFTALQPPQGFEQRHAKVSEALDRAAGLITDARTARVAEETTAYDDLQRSLVHERALLTRLMDELG